MSSAVYRRIALQSPELANLVGVKSLSIRQGAEIFPSAELSVPPIEFGDVSPMGMYGSQGLSNLPLTDELGFWNNTQVTMRATYAFEVADAIVHPPTGIVTVGDHVLDDTIAHAPFHLPGYGLAEDHVVLPTPQIGINLHSALHATGGNATNHFHWLLEIVPKLRVDPFAPSISDGVVLLPPVETAAQSEILALLKGRKRGKSAGDG